jgi:spermidine synthase
MMRYLPHALSFAAGFLSLSQEILWTRLVGFSYGGIPQAFAFVLATYLLGIALGADIGKDLCRRAAAAASGGDLERALLRTCGWVLIVASGIDAAGPWIFATAHGSPGASGVACLVMMVTALGKSVLFPIVHQLGSGADTRRLGRGFSRVYCANIVGSTCGPLLTGFVLLDLVSLQTALALVATTTGVIGMLLLTLLPHPHLRGTALPVNATSRRQELILRAFTPPGRHGLRAGGSFVALLVMAALLGPVNLVQTVVSNGYGKDPHLSSTTIRHLIENRHGIVFTLADDRRGDVVFGDGVYDGRVNIDLATNDNRIDRAYLVAAVKHDARRVLVIGLSAGPWTRLLQGLPDLERVDAIEINPGYVDLITHYPVVSPLLADPRIVLHIDDGRRWLKRHPDERYDLIVMNTSVSWRAYATNLLSRDFLRIVQRHLNPGGVLNYNASVSDDAVKTAAAVFAHVRRYTNSVLAADTPFLPRPPEIERRLLALTLDGKPLLDVHDPKLRGMAATIAAGPFVTIDEIEHRARRPLEIITDRNMITEFKYGRSDFATFRPE